MNRLHIHETTTITIDQITDQIINFQMIQVQIGPYHKIIIIFHIAMLIHITIINHHHQIIGNLQIMIKDGVQIIMIQIKDGVLILIIMIQDKVIVVEEDKVKDIVQIQIKDMMVAPQIKGIVNEKIMIYFMSEFVINIYKYIRIK